METSFSNNSSGSSRTHPGNSQRTGQRIINVRQPVSCEPCRNRKIKCSRTRPPCDTCRRRGCPAACIYKSSGGEPSVVIGINQELLDRISNLEDLLRKHTGTSATDLTEDIDMTSRIPSPPIEQYTLQPSPPMEEYEIETSQSFVQHDLFTPVSPSQSSHSSEYTSIGGVGTLSFSSNGNIQYQARSTQWNSVLANTSLSVSTPSYDEEEDSEAISGFPFTSLRTVSMDEVLTLLPPMRQCDYLKNTYFAVFSPLIHILHDPTFEAQYELFTEDPSSASLAWLAILFVLLALGVTALEENDPVLRDLARGTNGGNNIRLLSKRYREAAMQCLAKQGVMWGKHNVQSLQALVLLLYAMGHSQDHTWPLLGMTYNVAIALACHIDPSRFNLDPIQCEERRRCWAGLMMQYTIQNTFLGNPDLSRYIHHEVNLPADIDDVHITRLKIQEKTSSGPSQMSYLLLKFQLYDLSATICREIFASSEPRQSTIQELDRQICAVQESWEKRYLADSAIDALPTHHAMHLHLLHAYSHQLFLLLHRPFFARSVIGLEVPNESQIRCISSAEALLDIYRLLNTTPRFRPYMWYTSGLGSFHAFHAAAVLSVVLLMPNYKPQYQRFSKTLQDTLTSFEASAARSKTCEKSAKILRFLIATPSPNHSPTEILDSSSNASERTSPRENWLGTDSLKIFAERLDPSQWLGPASMAWTEWDDLMVNMASGTRVW